MRAKVVVVTGASAGVGRATVRGFARRGAWLGLIARGRDRLEATAREVERLGGQALVLPGDVSDSARIEEAAAEVEARFGAHRRVDQQRDGLGGLAGGTKGAVVGGLLGALAGGAIGNYVERRDAAVPQTPSPPQPTSPPQTVSSPPGTAGPTGSATPRAYTNGAVVVRVDQVQAQPSLLRPGETVTLNATYSILSPPDRPVAVRESREIRLNGELVANPAVDVARQTSTYSTALPITIPANAWS